MGAQSAVQREYDRLAGDYDRRWDRYVAATNRLAVEGCELPGDATILDLACGTGELARHLRERFPDAKIAGVDLSREMLKRAQAKRIDYRGLAQSASDRLPFADATFDAILCVNAFHYFRRPDAALGEMRRVLRPSGRLILVDWCDDYLSCKLCSVWLRWTDPAFYRTYGLARCRRLLRRNGFKLEASERRRIDWLWGLMRLDSSPAAG